MAEFTGERVVPGLVNTDLFNEHVSRYRFAVGMSQGRVGLRVLDAGCGTGYGAALFSHSTNVVAMDVSSEALQHAAGHYNRPNIQFARGVCERLPFADRSFDLVCAFEVIEHLDLWRDLLLESRRVLKSGGRLLVSTPNKAYYAEARAEAGPNPFHRHEFEYEEFCGALEDVFPHVTLWSQNHAEAIVFSPLRKTGARADAEGDAHPGDAHFFLAACSAEPIADAELFAWIPQSGNVLRERERHIAKLAGELVAKDEWLARRASEHSSLQDSHEHTEIELAASNAWALTLEDRLKQAEDRVVQLQKDQALLEEEALVRVEWVRKIEEQLTEANVLREKQQAELAERADWTARLDATLALRAEQVMRLEADVQERTAWAARLDADLTARAEQVSRLETDLQERTAWAVRLDADLLARADAELSARAEQVARLEKDLEERGAWAARLDADLAFRAEQVAQLEADLAVRGEWGFRLNTELTKASALIESLSAKGDELAGRMERIAEEQRLASRSKWMRLGRRLHVGPKLGAGFE